MLPTADHIIKHGGQVDLLCKQCFRQQESHTHMVVKCTFAKEMWRLVETWSQQEGLILNQDMNNIKTWWKLLTQDQPINCQWLIPSKHYTKHKLLGTREEHIRSKLQVDGVNGEGTCAPPRKQSKWIELTTKPPRPDASALGS